MNAILLQADGIGMRFGGFQALAEVDYDVKENSVACIIGPNGAGKSTFLNIITGTLAPTAGSVRFASHAIAGLPPHRIARLGIARKFQIPSVFPTMTVGENIDVALWGGRATESAAEMLDMIGLSTRRQTLAGDLAHGEKQWLEIGMAIATGPKLLLLDEPTAGMTPEETRATADLVHRLSSRCAIVAVEHDINFVRALDADTLVLHQGRFFRRAPFAEIEADDAVRDVYLGRR